MSKKSIWLLLLGSLLLSAAAHVFFLHEWTEGRFMAGPNDGLSQIVPFKTFIYEQYSKGTFFYSWGFGLGGGFYSQLAYYYSTSAVFLLTMCAVFLMESFHIIGPPDFFFWLKAGLIVSILRLSVILFVSTLVYRYMNIHTAAAFSGAAVYGVSIMYFRHVVFWEFFADAMLWVPLLVFGVEKIIREERSLLFIVTLSFMLIHNFYFAYINLIFLFIYMVFRWMFPLTESELSKGRQLKWFIQGGGISFCISAVALLPAVYGFLNNARPVYQQEIPWFDFTDNILFSSRFIILPSLVVLFLLTRSFYQHRVFAFFAALSLFLVLLHFSPLAASAFNGFSAPQYRWEYVLSFTAGGVTGAGLNLLRNTHFRPVFGSVAGTILLYGLIGYAEQRLPISSGQLKALYAFILSLLLMTVIIVLLFSWKKKKWTRMMLQGWVLLSSVLVVNVYQKYAVSDYSVHQVSNKFLTSDDFNSEEQQQLIEKIKHEEGDRLFRIDWMTAARNNTPIVQGFNGTSLYSSILNEALLFFYWHDLKIDMGRESVSRFATLGSRSNLHSLLQADYWMREKNKSGQAPYGFVLFAESENYVVYKNTMPLPFVRTVKNVFSEKDLQSAPPLDREHAMLEGIILNRSSTRQPSKETNHIGSTVMETIGAAYQQNRLTVSEKTGGIDLIPDRKLLGSGDFYVHFTIENLDGKGFSLKVNDYRTTRKHGASIYKTGVNDLVIRVPKREKVSIRVPEGRYELKGLALYEEDYRELKMAAGKEADNPSFEWNRNKISIDYHNRSGEMYMMLPIPYEKGWELSINGEQQPVEKANYAWTGFALKEGINHIEFVYYPPYFQMSLFLSLAGILGAVIICRRRPICRLKNPHFKEKQNGEN
ncbi:hypothetical protein BTO30_10815 [Domibacillus antri]|uniref:YfhO family protein n=1 Tax=Domibacillus antri TaxID=1714264 RepID=A0A1Q8Q4M8_9BACI|nr:YfhO family protein [Domibacillus antri]OLN22231.1 hypothetical protein BTO30_10815 [Domibacillus antri]